MLTESNGESEVTTYTYDDNDNRLTQVEVHSLGHPLILQRRIRPRVTVGLGLLSALC